MQSMAQRRLNSGSKLKVGGGMYYLDDSGKKKAHMDMNGGIRYYSEPEPRRHWAAPVTTFTNGKTPNGGNDSDTLWWNEADKYNQVSMKLFGDKSQMWWDRRTPQQVEAFLREYFDDPKLELVQIQKMYNVSNGFPIWHFSYIYTEK